MIDFNKTYPIEFGEFDEVEEIDLRENAVAFATRLGADFMESVQGVSATIVNMRIDQELKGINKTIDSGRYYYFMPKAFEDINFYALFKNGWNSALAGNYCTLNSIYKRYDDILDQLTAKFTKSTPPPEYFEHFSKVAVKRVTEGMAWFIYHNWLTDYAFDEIKKQHKQAGNDEPMDANDKNQQNNSFADCIVLYRDDAHKQAILKKLHELLDGKKGKQVAIVIRALQKLSIITIRGNQLYRIMDEEFGNIGTKSNINDFLNLNSKHYLKDDDISKEVNILKAL